MISKHKLKRFLVGLRNQWQEMVDPEFFSYAKKERLRAEYVELFMSIPYETRITLLNEIYGEVKQKTLIEFDNMVTTNSESIDELRDQVEKAKKIAREDMGIHL